MKRIDSIGILREQEDGVATAEACRRHGIGAPTLYKCKAKFSGMDVAEAKQQPGLAIGVCMLCFDARIIGSTASGFNGSAARSG